MEQFRFVNNDLWVEDLPLAAVVREYGTPLYVYSKRSLIDHCRWIEQEFAGIDHLSCYAVKANANASILRLLAAEGMGADVGSIGELHLALQAEFPPEKITFSGVGKRDDEIEFALNKHILCFNVESEQEIEVINGLALRLGTRARILLRVNLDIEAGTHPYITTGSRSNKFGVEFTRAHQVLCMARERAGIEVLGIHNHIGSQIIHGDAFIAAAHALVKLAASLRSEGIPIQHLNFGGGFGVQYHNYVTHPLLPDDGTGPDVGLTTRGLLREILPILTKSGCKIVIQPGRSVVAHAGILLMKVLYRKENAGKVFLVMDAGMNDLIRPSLYQSYHQIVPLKLAAASQEVVDVVGPLCESGDFLALNRTLPRSDRGDVLAVLCTGAYGYVLSSNYNMRPRPAEVMVDGGASSIIRAAETIQDL